MGQEYSWEVRERAEELYIVDGLTLDQVAAATGVSRTQVQRWAAEDGWGERRREYRRALGEIRRNTVLLRKKLIAQALESPEPQNVYAVARLEAACARGLKMAGGDSRPNGAAPAAGLEEPRIIRTPQDAVAALEEVVERRLNDLLTGVREVDLSAVKNLKQCLELIETLKAKYQQASDGEGPAPGLSDEAAAEIRRQILGVG